MTKKKLKQKQTKKTHKNFFEERPSARYNIGHSGNHGNERTYYKLYNTKLYLYWTLMAYMDGYLNIIIIIIIVFIEIKLTIATCCNDTPNKLPRSTALHCIIEHKALACRPSIQPNIWQRYVVWFTDQPTESTPVSSQRCSSVDRQSTSLRSRH